MGVGSTVSRFQEALGGDFILTENRANKSSASEGDKRWRHRKAGGNLLPPAHQRSNYSNTADPGDDLNTAEQATCTWGGGDHPEKGAVAEPRSFGTPALPQSCTPGRRKKNGAGRGQGPGNSGTLHRGALPWEHEPRGIGRSAGRDSREGWARWEVRHPPSLPLRPSPEAAV